MNPSASLDPFLELVAKSGLLAPERLAPFAAGPAVAREQTAARLLAEGLLTPYQARLLLNGWYRGFFVADKYKILDLLGEGGMGRVYLCEQVVLRRLVAVKQLQMGSEAIPGASERFLREAVAVAALDHPNIARIYDADQGDGGPFLVMEAVDGVNLHQLTARLGRLPVARAAGLIRQAALGLQHAHERGLVHRDIKPGNLMVDRAGTVKILDLGLARFFDASRNDDLTGRFDSRRALGTAEFMSPEQALNSSEVDTRADLYSLGGTLYFLLLGRFPYEAGTAFEKLHRHQTEPFDAIAPQRPEVPAGLIAVLDKMVAKRPGDRYRNPAAAAAALKPFCAAPQPLTEAEHAPPPGYRLGLSQARGGLGSAGAATPAAGHARVSTAIARPPARDPLPAGYPPEFAPTGAFESGDSWALTVRHGQPAPPARRPRRRVAGLAAALLVAAAAAVLGARSGRPPPARPAETPAAEVAGAGSTLARPLFELWKEPGVHYEATGSASGVRRVLARSVEFAATDVPLTDAQIRAAEDANGPVRHVPLALSAVAVSHNLPGAAGPLRLTGPLLADIYLGRVTSWDDPALAELNPGLELPRLAIVAVRRSDGSGTTAVFTDFLARSSPAWAAQGAAGTEPAWPPGPRALAAPGNAGVAELVGRTPGAVGYMDPTHALTLGLPLDLVRNRAGVYVGPTPAGLAAAMREREASVPPDLRFSLADAPGRDAYPIAGAVWAVAYVRLPPPKARALRDYLRRALERGPGPLESLGYGPLPPGVRAKALAAAEELGG